jgi:hypothetical protein
MYEAWMMKSGALALSIGLFASLAGSVRGTPPMNLAISTSDSMTRSRADIMSYSDDFGVYAFADVEGGDGFFNPTSADTYVRGDLARALARGRSSGSAITYHDEVRSNAFLEEYTQSTAAMGLTEVEAENSGEGYIYVNPQGNRGGWADTNVVSYVAALAEEEGSSLSELAQRIMVQAEETFAADRAGSYGWPTSAHWIADLVSSVVESNE